MTLQTAYTQSLSLSSALTSNYRYAIPFTVSVGKEALRLTLGGANTTCSSVYVAKKGSGPIDFTGTVHQVKVGGSGSWSGVQECDPIPLETANGDQLVVFLDAAGGSGKSYPYQSGVSGKSYYYASGVGGAANADLTKTGFSSVSSASAFLATVVVGDAADFDVPEDPPPVTNSTLGVWHDALDADQLYSGGGEVASVPNQTNRFTLYNPANSGRKVYLMQVTVKLAVPGLVTIKAANLPITGDITQDVCNLRFAATVPASQAKLRKTTSAIAGGFHSMHALGAYEDVLNKTPFPICSLAPGDIGVQFEFPVGVGGSLSAWWQEKPY